jgi:hypothetical protein
MVKGRTSNEFLLFYGGADSVIARAVVIVE